MDGVISAFEGMKVLVVGDVMLDRYVWGKVGRISPEAPVPVVQAQHTTETLGGAGNVVNNLAALGCSAILVGVCGSDPNAAALKALLAHKGIQERVVTDSGRPTITKTRIMAEKQQILRLDVEHTHAVTEKTARQVQAAAFEAMQTCRAVVISDYGKGLFPDTTLTQQIIQAAHRRGLPVLVDPKGLNWERYRGATGITPNTAEFEALTGDAAETAQALLASAAKKVRSRFALDWLLITRGDKGMCLVSEDHEATFISAQAREVFDVSGAGDTVIASLAAGLGAGLSVVEAARLANLAAGIVVGKLGTQPILASELENALHYADQRNFPYSAAKMSSLDAALGRIMQWKTLGHKVVFTNGCFDLLHPGHISLLHQARALGDRLVVGLNTDASIQRLKGKNRPILAASDRGAILCALECVDLVICFDEDTPLDLIKAIQPDILVKGSDYTLDRVVGREVVESYGGCVKLVDLVRGYSTTQITQKVLSGMQN
jgi:D-beta-D-heptose 7-phosphate kinase / D-beta-D-heptose 1-phosphate adenosyltransferase